MAFPVTRHSVIADIASPDPDVRRVAFDGLVAAYWRPVYTYLRLRWHADPHDAEDLTQEFFARAFEKELLGRFDASRARFRTFLRVCLDGFAANEQKAANRIKRGGSVRFVQLDFTAAEVALPAHIAPAEGGTARTADDDALFRREWVRSLFTDAVAALEETLTTSGRLTHLEIFRRYDLDDAVDQRPTYAALAAELDLPVTTVTNQLAFARREFRRIVLDRLRALSGSEEEFRLDARDLLGVEVP